VAGTLSSWTRHTVLTQTLPWRRRRVEHVAAEVNRALHTPQSLHRHQAPNAVVPASGGDFAGFIAAEQKRWRQVVAQRQISAGLA
jgi:hypothetical protein